MTRLLLILSFVEEFDKIVFLEINLLNIVRKVCVLGIIVCVYTLVGGFHGDKNITEAPIFTLDGMTVELGASGTYTGTTLEFIQNSIIDRCNNTGENIAKHSQIYKIDPNGIRVK